MSATASNRLITERIRDFARRPLPFSCYTAPELWDDPHISREMLKWHLDPRSDVASYRPERIDRAVAWLDTVVSLRGKRVCDLGCGPGLYASRIHDLGAAVTGIDVSARSLRYAGSEAREKGRDIDYRRMDYTKGPLPGGMDVILMISRDLGALSPAQRADLLTRIRTSLEPGGTFVFDVSGLAELEAFVEEDRIEADLMEGFWSESPYVGLKKAFKFTAERVTLDRYLILREAGVFEVFNWLQYFAPENIEAELAAAGFERVCCFGDHDGSEWWEGAPVLVVTAQSA